MVRIVSRENSRSEGSPKRVEPRRSPTHGVMMFGYDGCIAGKGSRHDTGPRQGRAWRCYYVDINCSCSEKRGKEAVSKNCRFDFECPTGESVRAASGLAQDVFR